PALFPRHPERAVAVVGDRGASFVVFRSDDRPCVAGRAGDIEFAHPDVVVPFFVSVPRDRHASTLGRRGGDGGSPAVPGLGTSELSRAPTASDLMPRVDLEDVLPRSLPRDPHVAVGIRGGDRPDVVFVRFRYADGVA